MKKNIKEWKIIGVIALIIVLAYTILMSFQVTYWKHQNIAYEQYKKEDLRQARIYNSTFAKSKDEFSKKIEDYPEQDQTIAKTLFEIKPEVDSIRKELHQHRDNIENLKDELSTKHNILGISSITGISTSIETYLADNNISGEISFEEYNYLYKVFCPESTNDNNYSKQLEFAQAIEKHNITIASSKTYRSYQDVSQDLSNENELFNQGKTSLNDMKQKYIHIIEENSPALEYQETIKTNGIKTAVDYLFTI